MGGPSRESYLKAKEAQKNRLAALRTRRGVVDLGEWRKAAPVACALEGMLHEPPWLLAVRLVVAEKVGFEIHAEVLWDAPQARMCLPQRDERHPGPREGAEPRTRVAASPRRPCPSVP
jgi:hypothetical protein